MAVMDSDATPAKAPYTIIDAAARFLPDGHVRLDLLLQYPDGHLETPWLEMTFDEFMVQEEKRRAYNGGEFRWEPLVIN